MSTAAEFDLSVRPCNRHGCRCTHTEGCEFGWIEAAPLSPSAEVAVRPCPTCRPDRATRGSESRQDWLARLRSGGQR